MGVTIREVAKAAGVSTAAVSKVLHGRGSSVRVSEERAKIIREAAKSLNYRPNALARNLRSSRTHTVGLLFENFWNISGGPLYYLHLLDGVASPLFKNHYRLTILPEIAQDDVLGSLCDGLLEGVIWCKFPQDGEAIKSLADSPIPIVALSAPPAVLPAGVTFVSCDNAGGIDLAVEHLWSLGHRRILFLYEQEEGANPDCMARKRAFLESLGRRGAVATEQDVAAWTWEFEEYPEWWDSHPVHTAVVCWSESAASRLLARTRERGVDIPNELSVVGFDSTQYCETTTPRLTAVRQPIFEIARFASESLLAIIRGDRPESLSTTFPCTLDVRESTAPPRDSKLRI
jgi:LacI family transcriptional regulator